MEKAKNQKPLGKEELLKELDNLERVLTGEIIPAGIRMASMSDDELENLTKKTEPLPERMDILAREIQKYSNVIFFKKDGPPDQDEMEAFVELNAKFQTLANMMHSFLWRIKERVGDEEISGWKINSDGQRVVPESYAYTHAFYRHKNGVCSNFEENRRASIAYFERKNLQVISEGEFNALPENP